MCSNARHPGHLGVQLIASLLARSTTQTAIVLGAGMGCVPPQIDGLSATDAEPLFRAHAAAEMLGILRTALVGTRIVDIGHENRAEAKKFRQKFNKLMEKQRNSGPQDGRKDESLKVDLVVTPIDGAG